LLALSLDFLRIDAIYYFAFAMITPVSSSFFAD